MTARETSRDIDEAASAWTARLDRGPLTAAENETFETWLNADPRRKGAFLRARAVSMMSESARALGPGFDPVAFAPASPPLLRRMSRRQALAWTGGATVAAAALAAVGVSIPAAGAVISTGRGEIRMIPLQDGSTVLLNTDTSIRVAYGRNERMVTVLGGEAYFTVTRDDRRPFMVDIGGRRLRVAYAAFRLRQLGDTPVDLLVQQGEVSVSSGSPQTSLMVPANTRLVLVPSAGTKAVEVPQAVAPEFVTRDLAWREGKIAFEGETLAQAARAFARYSDTHIVIRDPDLAGEPVTGLFAANDPAGFSRAIARVFDASARVEGNDIVLRRDAPVPPGNPPRPISKRSGAR